ncbi:MAG: serine protease, partial [Beijerinckiaceae bacterium]|nr:serine protease [Beijerinckiaceae bacterium]
MGMSPEFCGLGRIANGAGSRWRAARGALAISYALALGIIASSTLVPAQAYAKGLESLAELADSVSDAVVNISATQTIEDKRVGNVPELGPGTPFEDLFEEFFRRHQQG